MKKSTKLLSVLLAVLMIFSSMSVMAYAALPDYKTVDSLSSDGAYDSYGSVTRLSTEERLVMVFDYLNTILATTGIKGSQELWILGSLTYDITSIDGVLTTIDSVRTLLVDNAALLITVTDAIAIVDYTCDTWQTGMKYSDGTTAPITIGKELLEMVNSFGDIVFNILKRGSLEIGDLGSFVINLVGLDLSSVNEMLSDIPGLIKGMIFPLFERKDDSQTQITALEATSGDGGVEDVLTSFVQGLFTKAQSTQTYKEDANENSLTTDIVLPTQSDALRYAYEKSYDNDGNPYYTCYVWDSTNSVYVAESEVFKRVEESDGVYIYQKAKSGDTLKYYASDSYWLPSLAKSTSVSSITNIQTNSAASMLYSMIPYVFAEMAPVVLNGSVKKLLGEWFGMEYTHVGDVVNGEYVALEGCDVTVPSTDLNDTNKGTFFTEAQGDYLWEWSNYAVINGTHYYRYEDQIFIGDASNANPYLNIINWDYTITSDFVNQFIPSYSNGTLVNSKAGYDTILKGLNDFLVKAINTVFSSDFLTAKSVTFTTGEGNTPLVENAKKIAQAVVSYDPASILGSNYADDGYYDLMMSDDNQTVLNGIAAKLISLLMPQMILPSAEELKTVKVGAILTAVVRELATQLLPNHNYDALIYSDYTNKEFLDDKDNAYWLDVMLTIGTDIGVKYLSNLADMGEDTDQWAGMTAAGYTSDAKTYTSSDLDEINGVKPWEARIDYIIDWALSSDYSWCWSMSKFVTVSNVSLTTVEDPWVKLGTVLKDLLPVEDVFNVDYTSDTWLETLLRTDFVEALLDADVTPLETVLDIPDSSVLRQTDILEQAFNVILDLVNSIFSKAIGGNLIESSYSITTNNNERNSFLKLTNSHGTTTTTGTITGIDELLSQTNLAYALRQILINLYVAAGSDSSTDTGVVQTIMPILNFFVGWTTDAQEYEDVSLGFEKSNGYVLASDGSATTTLSIVNNSAGMLQTHRNSTVEDQNYVVTVKNVTSDTDEITTNVDFSDSANYITVDPFEINKDVTITIPYTSDKLVDVTITYTVTGKNGEALGGEQTVTERLYMSNIATTNVGTYDETTIGQESSVYVNQIGVTRSSYSKGIVTNDFSTILNYSYTFKNLKNKTAWVSEFSVTTEPDSPIEVISTDFVHGSSEDQTKSEGVMAKSGGDTTKTNTQNDTWTLYPYTYDEDSDAVKNIESGTVLNMGAFSITFRNSKKNTASGTLGPATFYYYNIDELQTLYDSVSGYQKSSYDTSTSEGAAAWDAFYTALGNAASLTVGPKNADRIATDFAQTNVDSLTDALQTAVDNLAEYEVTETQSNADSSAVDAAVTSLETALDTAEDLEADYNFQDYELYEYWDYESIRTTAREVISNSTAPSALAAYTVDTKEFATSADLDAFVADADVAQKGVAIKATAVAPTDEEVTARNKEIAAWTGSSYTELYVYDLAAKLPYYKQFMVANPVTANKQFLASEIEVAAANYGTASTSDVYSTDSWAAYIEAYNNAVTVNSDADALASEVFDAKYALMKAENDLLEATKSAKDSGALTELEALAAQAEAIFANSGLFTPVDGVTESDAWGDLITALGYKYTEDGTEYVLYEDSAYEYLTYDRETTTTNLSRIEASADALKAAIAQLECAVKVVADETVTDPATVVQDTKIVDGITPGTLASAGNVTALLTTSGLDENSYTAALDVIASAGGYGTGAKVNLNLSDKSGNSLGTVAVYYILVYGDVDGDSAVDGFDLFAVDKDINSVSKLADMYLTAGDTNGDGSIDQTDYSAISSEIVSAGSITQAK